MWEELHHQGDVGDASYAAVPELVRIHRDGRAADWNLYAMVAIIELARTESQNPGGVGNLSVNACLPTVDLNFRVARGPELLEPDWLDQDKT
jgi:hypothetical protein